ncbi:MAG TPA: heme-binding protein [Methylomirabilota bacterium]|nr:heme-binding protein [Methylomirabilota bacterium]
MTLKQAVACIERGVARAQSGGFLVAIAVVDEAGHLVACHRMDGALWITPEIARAKANAAAAFRTTTLDMEERFSKGSRALFAGNVASLGDYQLVFGKGGVPIVENRQVVGAVGVSGAVPAENDHTIAEAAAGGSSAATPHP